MKRLLVILLLVGSVDAAYLNLKWEYDTRESNKHAFVLNLNNDSFLEVVTDAPRSGLVFGISHNGSELWRFRAMGYVFDIYAKEFPFGSEILLGTYANTRCVTGKGRECWNYLIRRSKVVTTFLDDIDHDGKGEAIIGVLVGWRGNEVHVIKDGRTLRKYSLTKTAYPYALHATDTDGDGTKEIIIGTTGYSVNTLADSFQIGFKKDADVRAYDKELVWSFPTSGGVLALASDDLNGDGIEEILVGSNNFLYVLNTKGKVRWSHPVQANSLTTADIDGDGTPEILAGSTMLYAFQNNGTLLWKTGKIGTVNSITAADMDRDGKMEIFAGSDKLYIFNSEGTVIWSSESYKTINKIEVADLNGDKFKEVVISAGNGKVKMFESKTHVLGLMADNLYEKGKDLYKKGEYISASKYANDARAMYEELSEGDKILDAKKLSENSIDHITADNYSKLATEFYSIHDYENATDYAGMALDIYRRLNDHKAIENVSKVIDFSVIRPMAQDNYSVALSHYEGRDFGNALEPARKAYNAFMFIGDESESKRADVLLSRIEKQLDAAELYNLAVESHIRENYENASSYLRDAKTIYTELEDQKGIVDVEDLTNDIKGTRTWRKILLYGSMGFIAIIVVGALMVIITMTFIATVYNKKKVTQVSKKRGERKGLRDI